jgi:hypothetical protein
MTNRSATRNRIGPFSLLLITGALCNSPLLGQVDVDGLRAKYGPPVEEVLVLRPNITLSVLYGDNHQVCKLDLRPTRTASSVISTNLIQQLVDEIIPPSTRGTPKGEFASSTGAFSSWRWAEYEGVTVGQAGGDVTPNPEAKTQNPLAVIQFKSCQVPKQ